VGGILKKENRNGKHKKEIGSLQKLRNDTNFFWGGGGGGCCNSIMGGRKKLQNESEDEQKQRRIFNFIRKKKNCFTEKGIQKIPNRKKRIAEGGGGGTSKASGRSHGTSFVNRLILRPGESVEKEKAQSYGRSQ